ncbi:hypothetical protein, partial [Sansalvadorimonas verongulae]|uniref:hypothetical protein n=1 Tax=Sansalvadorimonas verongulae TaxID=2172824 RepID=UPI0018AD20FD
RVKQTGRIEGSAAKAGSVPPPFAPDISAALAVAFKLVNRIKGVATGAGGVPLPFASGISVVPLSSTYDFPFILMQYLHVRYRAIMDQVF